MLKTSVFILLILFSFTLFADDLLLEYSDGVIELETNAGWEEVVEGELYSSEQIIRLENDSIAEFSINDSRIMISEEGTYELRELINNSNNVSNWGIGELVTNKLELFFNETMYKDEAAMGVRGDQEEQYDDITWMENKEIPVRYGIAKDYILNKQYKEAVLYLLEASFTATGEARKECFYYIGYSYAMLGDSVRALRYLNRVETDSTKYYFHDYVLVKGKLLIQSFSFKSALYLFEKYLSEYPYGENVQSVYFLSAYCNEALNNREEFVKNLQKAVEVDPFSDFGKLASQKLNQ